MAEGRTVQQLVEVLKNFKPGHQLKHYIGHIQFPNFRSLEPGTRIAFEFPLVALVGANGIGKSSVLHALWGAPFGQSTSKFWFATELDPIVGTPRYFYSYWNDSYGGFVECKKSRVGQKRGLDYWEPARLSIPDGMRPLPAGEFEGKAKDRWNPVRRDVVYVNLKASFGSFDRFFYFDEGISADERRDTMLEAAKRLKSIVDRDRQSYFLGRRQRLFRNRDLTEEELKAVSDLLGREYQSARYVEHSLYPGHRGADLSVIFDRGSKYSEAFAGSGEVAAVTAVVKILAAPENSLILLDEPETSLHPGAQRALLRFLLEQIVLKQHQVVLSTHSMDFLDGLPHEAIKVFEDNGQGQTRVLDSSSPRAALARLGRPPADKKRVLVEDEMAALLLERALEGLDRGDAQSIEVKVAPGGADAILKFLGPAAMVSGDDVYVYLDGDKRKVREFTDPDAIPPASYPGLPELVKAQTGLEPMFHLPGGNGTQRHEQAKTEAHLQYLGWLRKHLAYLPRIVPEVTFLVALDPDAGHESTQPKPAKAALREMLSKGVELNSDQFHGVAKVAAASIPLDHRDLEAIRAQLRVWLAGPEATRSVAYTRQMRRQSDPKCA